MKFLDAADPQSQSQFTQALQHENAAGFAPYIGGNNTQQNQNWPPGLILALIDEGFDAMPVWVPWPATANGTTDGQAAAAIAKNLGVDTVMNDIEAGTGQPASQPEAPAYCAAWRDAVQAAGLKAGGYSNAAGIERCFAGYDRVWCATQGLADPCNIALHCPGAPGQRAVQCANGSWAGVSYDVNFSEYTFGGSANMPLSQDAKEGIVAIIYSAVLGRGPATETEAQQWAAQIGPNGENLWSVYQAISASDEGRNYNKLSPFGPDPAEVNPGPAARLDQLESVVKGLQVSPVGQHTHAVTLSGRSGSPGP